MISKAIPGAWTKWRRNAAMAAVLAAGVCASFGIHAGLHRWDESRIRERFDADAETRIRAIGRQIDHELAGLRALAGLIEIRKPLDARDFETFAARLMASHPGLLTVQWVARVAGPDERRAFEAELARNHAVNRQIVQGPPGKAWPEGEKAEYHPIRFAYPPGEINNAVLGFDMGSCAPCRQPLYAAASTGNPVAMGRLKTLEGTRDGYGVTVLQAAYRSGKDVPPDYAMLILQVGAVVENALQPPLLDGINIEFEDLAARASNQFLYRHGSAKDRVPGFAHAGEIVVGGRTWRLSCTPTAAYVAAAVSPWPMAGLLAGLAFTLLAAFLFHARRRVAGLEQAGTEMRRLQAEVENLALEKTLALLASEKRASRILQAANDGFWDWNVETGEVWFSAQWGRLLGYGQGEIPPRVEFFFSILHADDVERAREEVGKLVEGESNVRTFDVRVRRRAGEYLWVQWRGNAAERDPAGTVVRVVGTLTDLTETRRLEGDFRQAQKMETIGQMAGGIAHDFNNLLTVINGYSQRMLGRMGPADPLRESAAGILQAGRRAADLTKQLLAFSRNSTYAPAVLDVNEMVDGSESILRRIAGDAVRLEVVRNRDAGRVKIDPTQFRQVLLNLTANAKDAMPNGGRLRIEVSSVELDEDFAARNMGTSPGRYVRVDVSDTGTGMGEASRPRVFEPFFTTKEHGTGLGLATVHGIVRQHGGWISVHSDPSSGTTFRTYWPRTEEVAEAVPAGFGAASVEGGSETVLVVEDQADVRAMVAEMLASLGYRTLQTAGGETALAVAAGERGRIDLLLTDVAMYGMDGVRLAARMVGQRPDLKVLFMSGLGEQAVPEGAEFLAKPFTREGLAAKLRTVLDGVVNVG